MPASKRQKIERGIYRENGFYYVEWYDQYKKRHRKKCSTLQYSRRYLNTKRKEVWQNQFDPTSVRQGQQLITFDEIVKDRLEIIKGLASFEGELAKINFWKKRFKNCLVSAVTHQEIEKSLVDLLESVKPSTRNLYFSSLNSIFALALKNDKLDKSPCAEIKRIKENNEVIRWLDIGEERKLMEVMPEEFQLIVRVAINTGLRVSEQMSLTWDDIDFRTRQITLRKTKSGETQFVSIENEEAYLAFRRLKEMIHPHISGEIFHWINQYYGYSKTRGYYNLNYAWKRYCKMAGIKKCRWHDLRHTFASRMVINGVPILVVQQLMRHSDVKTTMRYSHLAPKNLKDALQGLSGWYSKDDNWQEIDTQQPSLQPSVNLLNY